MRIDPSKVAEGWLHLQNQDIGSDEYELAVWASSLLDSSIEYDPDYAWDILIQILSLDSEQLHVRSFSTNVLEYYIFHNGFQSIQRIIEMANKDAKFNYALSGVQRTNIKGEVWDEILKVQDFEWE